MKLENQFNKNQRKGGKNMFSLAYAILCICSIYLALEKDKQNGKLIKKDCTRR